jgi:hypothetical protein
MISREWYLFFQGVFNRVGGADGSSTTELEASLFEDAGSSETNAMLFELDKAVGQMPAPTQSLDPQADISPSYPQFMQVEALQAELSQLRETVAELKKDLDSLRQGILI